MGLVWGQPSRRAAGGRRAACRSPELLELPAFVAVPRHDRIVPAASAEALARRLPQATVARPLAGHVSMVVGERGPGPALAAAHRGGCGESLLAAGNRACEQHPAIA